MKFMKRLGQGVLAAGVLLLGLGIVQKVQAASTDTINVMVTAGGVSYGVQITSPDVGGYQFGTVSLGATTNSTVAITVANTGTISEYFSMSISSTTPTSGSDKWGPVNTAPGLDTFELFGLFQSTASAMPSPASFTNALLTTTLGTAGHNVYGQTNGAFTDNAFGRTPPTAQPGFQRGLWLQLKMPTDLSDGNGGAQTMVLSIDGQAN